VKVLKAGVGVGSAAADAPDSHGPFRIEDLVDEAVQRAGTPGVEPDAIDVFMSTQSQRVGGPRVFRESLDDVEGFYLDGLRQSDDFASC